MLLEIREVASMVPEAEADRMFNWPVRVLIPVPDWVYAPSLDIPEIPVKAPDVDMSQSDVLIEPVSPLSPRVKVLLPVKEPLPLMFNPVPLIPAAVNDLVTFNEPRKLLDPVERPEKVPVNVSFPFTARLPPMEA